MFKLLSNLRVVEGASFIAAPSCALYFSQLGADVIRFDDIRRSLDRNRWPLAKNGSSLYWEGLNKGKKSVAFDLSRPEGREVARQLITAPGPNAGLFVTNFPSKGFLNHQALAERRPDLITLRVMGWSDGRQAVDYTVNSAIGIPMMTGPDSVGDEPVNHVLPAWDLLTGAYGAFCMLAAVQRRSLTQQGGEIRLPLSDVALTTLGNLGQIAEVCAEGKDRERMGNDLFGAFGRDFVTRDHRRIMLVAITPNQWRGLVDALGIGPSVSDYESTHGVDFANEGQRFIHRHALFPLVQKAVGSFDYEPLVALLNAKGVCWGPYRGLHETVQSDLENGTPDGLFTPITHPSGMTYPTPGAASHWISEARDPARPAPVFGGHTEDVLATVLGYSSGQIARLVDEGVILRPS
jgi:2-methylfumaryl-CoA isomerase